MRVIFLTLVFLTVITLCVRAQILASYNWKPGYYYNLKGDKVSGFICAHEKLKNIFSGDGDFILFKKEKDAKKKKISSDSLTSFVVSDTGIYFVSHFDDLKETPFIQLLRNSKNKLYFLAVEKTFGNFAYTSKTYYTGPNPDDLMKINKKNFIVAVSLVLADKPDVIKLLQDKTFTYDNFDQLLIFLKTGQVTLGDDNDQ